LARTLKSRRVFKDYFLALLITLFPLCVVVVNAPAYIMPIEQLVGFVSANFSNFKTLVVSQSTRLVNPQSQGPESVFQERIWLKSPGFYYREPVYASEGQGKEEDGPIAGIHNPDMSFRRLFMAGDGKTILEFLSEIGVNLGSITFTRFDGVIVYHIGDTGLENPKLLIEKERFLPMLLSYGRPAHSGEQMVTVRFEEYRKIEKGWYPYKIVYSTGNDMEEHYAIKDLQVNIPVTQTLSIIPGPGTLPAGNSENKPKPEEGKRLKEVIEALKKKYRE
jgi:hypothetical protein